MASNRKPKTARAAAATSPRKTPAAASKKKKPLQLRLCMAKVQFILIEDGEDGHPYVVPLEVQDVEAKDWEAFAANGLANTLKRVAGVRAQQARAEAEAAANPPTPAPGRNG